MLYISPQSKNLINCKTIKWKKWGIGMHYPLISVIMPVYNVENFVKRAFDSMIHQTYQNIEILVIDDGSIDGTSKICDDYAKKDSRIHIVKQKNAGAAAARNHGMRLAKGEYILFMDSDDTMHPKTIEILYQMVTENKVNLGMVNFLEVEEPYTEWKEIEKNKVNLFSQEKMLDILCSGGENLKLRLLLTVPWCKLYHYQLLEGISYPEGTICEDEFMINDIVRKCKKMAYMDISLYGYLVRPGSVMHRNFDRKRLASMKAFEERIQCAKDLGFKSCENKMIKIFVKDHIGNYCRAYLEECEDSEVYRWLKQSFRKNLKKYWKKLDSPMKIKSIIFFLSPQCYLWIKKFILHDIYEH